MAYRRGEDSDEAMVGALIRATEAADLRSIGALARGMTKGGGGG